MPPHTQRQWIQGFYWLTQSWNINHCSHIAGVAASPRHPWEKPQARTNKRNEEEENLNLSE